VSIKDKLGQSMANYIYPYMQSVGGRNMPKRAMEYEDYCLQEKYLWYLGDEDLLADFYQSNTPKHSIVDTRRSYYYSNVDGKIRIIHSGMPELISSAKAELLMAGGIKEDVYIGETENEEAEELLEEILDDNSFKNSVLKNAIVTESWAGRFALRISFDKEVTPYPIVEKYNPFNYEAIYKRGRLEEIIFKEQLENHELHERYGKGYVIYELYRKTSNGLVEVPLTDLPETAELEDVKLPDDMMLAVEKCTDKSDYKGIVAEFDALDEAWSQLMDEIRSGRSEIYVPDMLASGKVFNDFRKKYVLTGLDQTEGAKNQITHNQPEIRTVQYIDAIIAIRDNILANVKLNPLTIGIDDSIGANASGDSLEKRETVSLRTRKAMMDTWEPFLSELYELLLNAYNWHEGKSTVDYTVEVKFGEYITPSIETRIDNAVKMRQADIIDDEKALEEIYGESLTDEEKDRILSNNGNITLGNEEQVK
jgi:hypothetical protein